MPGRRVWEDIVSWRDRLENLQDSTRDLIDRGRAFLSEHDEEVQRAKPFLIALPLLLLAFWVGFQVVGEVRQETATQAVAQASPTVETAAPLADPPLTEVVPLTQPRPVPSRAHPHPAALETARSTAPQLPTPDPVQTTPIPIRPHPSLPATSAPPVSGEEQLAQATVRGFYDSINRGEYDRAYFQLSPEWQRELPYGVFARGYSTTEQVTYRVDNVTLITGNRARVDARLDVMEYGMRVEYLATYLVVETRDGWRIDRASQFRT